MLLAALVAAFTRSEKVVPGVVVRDEYCKESDKLGVGVGVGFVLPPVGALAPPPQETNKASATNEIKHNAMEEAQQRRPGPLVNWEKSDVGRNLFRFIKTINLM